MTGMSPERARLVAFFDGLMGREPSTPNSDLMVVQSAYADGYDAGRSVWRRPRRYVEPLKATPDDPAHT